MFILSENAVLSNYVKQARSLPRQKMACVHILSVVELFCIYLIIYKKDIRKCVGKSWPLYSLIWKQTRALFNMYILQCPIILVKYITSSNEEKSDKFYLYINKAENPL